MPRGLLPLLALAAFLAACSGGDASAPPAGSPARDAVERMQREVSGERLRSHLRALQRIAAAHGGTRESGSPGYAASVEYVAARLRAAGYEPKRQAVDFTYSRETAPPELQVLEPEPRPLEPGEDFVAFKYSGSGEAQGAVEPVGLGSGESGCDRGDFEGFPAGALALLERGGCFFYVKVANAAAAGAAAALVVDDSGRDAPVSATLLRPAPIPALSLARAAGAGLARLAGTGRVEVRLRTQMRTSREQTTNVLADLPGHEGPPILLGAHLDSVAEGPGINDNGSGVAALLEIARAARKADSRPARSVRFAFWAAEELGLVGSSTYAERLGADVDEELAAVLNFDMLGSPNGEAFVYDADETIERWLTEGVRRQGLEPVHIALEGRSDHAAFEAAGVPVGGLFSGADGRGPGGEQHDPCYHLACDTVENVDVALLEGLADATVFALFGRLTYEDW